VFTVLALWEYFALGDAIGHRAYRIWTIVCSLLMIAAQFAAAGPPSYFNLLIESPLTVFFVFLFGITCLTLWTRRPLVESLPAAGVSSSAFLLVSFPLSYAVRIHGDRTFGPRLLLFALVITWAADTSAYFVGRAIGKHPLAAHISPKKTWEGSVGSMIGSLIVAYAFSFWIPIPTVHLFAMAAIGNVAGQMGDLLESAYKRSAGVKDSGGLLPGHGGILDRIDALILCFPVIWYYLVLVNPPIL
jgi:phosphatidate cytidylyltransferase